MESRLAGELDAYEAARVAAKALRARGFDDHEVLIVLGSGWQGMADALGVADAVVPMAEIPGFHPAVAEGHGIDIRSYEVAGSRVLALLGRTHHYEGYGPAAVAHGVRTAAELGCHTAILTNANGAFRTDWEPGDCMVVRDHLNLWGLSPLVGPRFVDLTDAYSPRLRELALDVHPEFVEGVYAMLPGPHYQTRAETEMLIRLGADVVGMSTVLETIAARELGIDVLALSMVTVIEGTDSGVDPTEVVAQAAQSSTALGETVVEIITRLGGTR